jgi:hypothetical protein
MAKGEDRQSLSGAGRELTPEQEAEAFGWIEAAVERTILLRPMPISLEMPESEIGRRVDMACVIFRDLCFEARWSRQRIRDHLEYFLTACIDGEKEHRDAAVVDSSGDPVVTSVMYAKQRLREIEGERRLSALAVDKACDSVGPEIVIKSGDESGEG